MPNGPMKITGLPCDDTLYKSEHTIEDEEMKVMSKIYSVDKLFWSSNCYRCLVVDVQQSVIKRVRLYDGEESTQRLHSIHASVFACGLHKLPWWFEYAVLLNQGGNAIPSIIIVKSWCVSIEKG